MTGEQRPTAPLLNIANGLTMLRIVLVPVFAVCLVRSELTAPGWRVAAAITFMIASATDYVDGWWARSRNLVTSFGKVADPIADKALTGTALVLLSGYGRVSWLATGVILARELGVTALRFWVIRHGVIAASRGGKVKTALQILAIVWLVLPLPAGPARIGTWIMWLAVAVTLVTGADYMARAWTLQHGRAVPPVGGTGAPPVGGTGTGVPPAAAAGTPAPSVPEPPAVAAAGEPG